MSQFLPRQKFIFLFAIIGLGGFSSCYYDKLSELSLGANIADPCAATTQATFTSVQPIINSNCAVSTCHVAGGVSPDLSTYQLVYANRANTEARVANGTMPPNGRTISRENVNMILCWIKSGALNN